MPRSLVVVSPDNAMILARALRAGIKDAREKRRRLEEQWPKKCGCGLIYTRGSWQHLPLAYIQVDAFCTLEARHCTCRSTIAVMLAIHDLRAE